MYNGNTYALEQTCDMWDARKDHGLAICDDRIYVLAGANSEHEHLNSAEIQDTENDTWVRLNMPKGGTCVSCATTGDCILITMDPWDQLIRFNTKTQDFTMLEVKFG